ncbi:MAG TPA: hypothetical protein PLI09_15405 [Candidatus Hydrogenedentes bacterium]|nr:hypothetical protein [Candidatus Hydrogenedentota bacterium]
MQQLLEFFGWGRFEGTVLSIDPVYMASDERGCLKALVMAALGILFLPVILGVGLGLVISGIMLSMVFGATAGRPSFLSNVASQLVGFFLTKKLFGQKDQIPVRDFRLMDSSGTQHHIRIKGDLTSGNVNIGDDLEVWGFLRHGTVILSRGINRRTGAQIRVR